MFYTIITKLLPVAPKALKMLISTEDNLVMGIIASIIATLIMTLIFKLNWNKHLERRISGRLLPVNTDISEEHLIMFKKYNDTISSRILGLLPEELKEAWRPAKYTTNRNMIPLQADESVSIGSKRIGSGRITDLLLFLDCEFFLNVKDRLQPITLQGEPGSGKSTLIFELYRQHTNRLVKQKQGWIPILLFAHDFSWEMLTNQTELKSLLVDYFQRCAIAYDNQGYKDIADFLKNFYEKYQFFIIIDGLDEFTDRRLYEDMSKKLNELLENEWKIKKSASRINRYLISCRTDDNQRIITSRLISLHSLDYNMVIKHLKKLQRYTSNTKTKRNLQNVIEGLDKSRTHRLLQNYILNPYLLSLIIEYYKDIKEPLATELSEVFEHILERELRKPRKEFESEQSQKERVQLSKYLKSLLAPYCFRRVMDSPTGLKTEQEDFRKYIEEDKDFAKALFGGNGYIGYLSAVYEDNSTAREDRLGDLSDMWGREKSTEFRDYLDKIRKTSKTYGAFVNEAINYLHNDIMVLLRRCNLAEIDEKTRTIKRFRHRRMQDYFMALFIDRVGIGGEGGVNIPLDNAWMREPIRILAAVSTKPNELISAFNILYDKQKENAYDDEHLNNISDTMMNASEAVAYLPNPQNKQPDKHLYSLVAELGTKARELYNQISQMGTVKNNQVQQEGWLNLQVKCLKILHNIYGSEFLRNVTDLLDLKHQRGWSNYWKKIHSNIQKEPNFMQHIAYTHLYPIKANQKEFPIKGYSMFSYVMDAALCFASAYNRLIKETHPKLISRFLPKIGKSLETLVSLSIIGYILLILANPSDISESLAVKVARIGIAVGISLVFSLVFQMRGYMEWIEFHHFGTWILLRILKRIWLISKSIFRKEFFSTIYSFLKKKTVPLACFQHP
jgi:hypothetical protein